MNINKLLTSVNFNTKNDTNRIKYIVIHYVGAEGGAEANCKYFRSEYRGSSAHYFVGHLGEIFQCVRDGDIAWHCGAKKYKHKHCRNSNSLGVEMCCKKDSNGKWYFTNDTVDSTVALTKELMNKYNIPVANVIRHYDVTGKICPEPYVSNTTAWKNFKKRLTKDAKSIHEVALDVIRGKYGNGTTRKIRLKAAGYDYNVIQSEVNAILRDK